MPSRKQNNGGGVAWRQAKRAELLKAGLPADVIKDDYRWRDILFQGEDLVTGWNPRQLTKTQSQRLLALLREHYTEAAGMRLLETLGKRARAK